MMGMSIQALWLKFKGYATSTDLVLSVLIIGVSGVSFYLGRISTNEVPNSMQSAQLTGSIINKAVDENAPSYKEKSNGDETTLQVAPEGGYVASKNGTKYHLPWCGGAKQIKEENKVWFKTKDEAVKAGYTPASNCKGI
jgi:hypothetical protein